VQKINMNCILEIKRKDLLKKEMNEHML
jgi:hypothetical protein